jgi:hypothetical protein
MGFTDFECFNQVFLPSRFGDCSSTRSPYVLEDGEKAIDGEAAEVGDE